MIRCAVPLLLLMTPSMLPAQDAMGAKTATPQARGWFWYEPLPEPMREPLSLANPPPTSGPKPLSSAWLREHLPLYLDRAIDTPTLANVRRYRYLERLALDRSSAYSDASARLTLLDPVLDEQQVSPLSALAKATRHREREHDTRQLLATIARDAGLWFFFRSDCPYCHAQVGALKSLEQTTGFRVLPISLDGKALPGNLLPSFQRDQGQAATLGVQVTPSLFLVRRDGRVLPLATGLRTRDELEFRILELGHALGWINEAAFARIRPMQHTMFDEIAAELGTSTEPDTLIDRLIERGADRFGLGTPVTLPSGAPP